VPAEDRLRNDHSQDKRFNEPRFIIGNLRVAAPLTNNCAYGSPRYPRETALRRDTAASVSVDWMSRSLWFRAAPPGIPWSGSPAKRPRPLPRPPRDRGPPRRDRRFGICDADIWYVGVLTIDETRLAIDEPSGYLKSRGWRASRASRAAPTLQSFYPSI
jgi:hypothetical protein